MTRYKSAMLAALVFTVGGVLPAVASPVQYIGNLLGSSVVLPVSSPGGGTVLVTFDRDNSSMIVNVSFSGLASTVTAAHIHCCTASPGINVGVAMTLPSFPSGGSAGVYANTFDMTQAGSYSAAFVNSQGGVPQAAAALTNAMGIGGAYMDLHCVAFPGGEVRANLFERSLFANGFDSP